MEGHGDHWGCMGPDARDAIAHWVPRLLERGETVGGSRPHGNAFGLAYPAGRLGGIALIARGTDDTGKPTNELASAYPLAREGCRYPIEITRIDRWKAGFEARIEGTFADALSLGFFDTLYHLNRDRYEVGRSCDFVLAALAYKLEVIHPEPIRTKDPETLERHRKMMAEIGQELTLTPDGALEFHLDGAAILFPIDGWDADDFQFQARVTDVVAFDLEGRRFYAMTARLAVVDDQEFQVRLFAADCVIDGPPPREGDDVRGALWLQGHLAGTLAATPDVTSSR